MKLPFDIGQRFILRLLLPCALIAMVLFPLADSAVRQFGYEINPAILFVSLALAASMALMLLEHPILSFMAGRRYWPAFLRRLGLALEAARLATLVDQTKRAADEARVTELSIQASEFPLNPATGEPVATYPTRLGNLVASYETYPTVKYQLDGVFFWPRLWVVIDKDLREELDSAQAVADGGVYACFVLVLAAPVAVADAFMTGHRAPWLVAAGVSLVLARGVYLAALPKYAQFGELFAAAYDQYRSRISFGALVEELDRHMADVRRRPRSDREASLAAWRFLKWHRYRRSNATENVIVKDWTR